MFRWEERALRYIALFIVISIFSLAAQESQPVPEEEQTEQRVLESELLFNGLEEEASDLNAVPEGVFGAGDLFRVLLILGFFALAIYGLLFFIRRSQRKYNDSELIHLIASRNLFANRGLHLVRVSDRVFFLGASEQNISLIAEITDKETLDELRLQAPEERRSGRRFVDFLFPRKKKNITDDGTSSEALSLLRANIEKLERLK